MCDKKPAACHYFWIGGLFVEEDKLRAWNSYKQQNKIIPGKNLIKSLWGRGIVMGKCVGSP